MAQLDRAELCVLSQAHAVALSALAGVPFAGGAARLAVLAEGLPENHPMQAAVARFNLVQSTRFQGPDDVADAARRLRHAVDLCLMPPPVGQDRVDIHG